MKYVIYHGNCSDGFGAAWAIYKKFGEDKNVIKYIPSSDRQNLPQEILNRNDSELLQDEVYFVDFCLPAEVLIELEKKVSKLVVLDHHVSVKSDIESVKEHVYGTDKSGAYLAWEYFHSNVKVPKIIEYICDQDLFRHTLPNWQEVISYLYDGNVEEKTFQDYDRLSDELENNYSKVLEIGGLLRGSFDRMVKKYESKAQLVEFAGYNVYAVNAPSEIKSELGNLLANKTNSFAIIYYYEEGNWKVSLRSVAEFDVSKIAAVHGGGGHKNAAAFWAKAEFPLSFINN